MLPGDEILRERTRSWCCVDTWEGYTNSAEFASPADTRFHLGLIPVPFIGNLARASVFVLLLNPGFGPHDYYADLKVRAFRTARIANLRQRSRVPFVEFDPEFSWHGGFRYWHSKLSNVISHFSKNVGISFGEARKFVQSQLAAIQLVPYHSATFALSAGVMTEMASVNLAKRYVHEVLLPKAKLRECLIIVARSGRLWDLRDSPTVIVYNGAEARSAHLSIGSRGGTAMSKFLATRFRARAA